MAEERKLSLHPLQFEEALSLALQVKPPDKPTRKGRKPKGQPDPEQHNQQG